ncbi:M23 family metallopeptidase [Alistipes sp. An54]|uniref:M23 family metallopeptidase n=1 Tax=Alistipes sp. An54 TaxID=1965645 RepID=UPI0011782913|nr:M23 family metallopeptidase [Alistipes sp. An54]
MMNRLLFVLSLLLAVEAVAGPQVRVKRDPATKVLTFYLEGKNSPGVLTLYFDLREVSNCNQLPGVYRYEIAQDGDSFLTLRPEDKTRDVGYNYAYRTLSGRVDSPVDTMFVYRIPATTQRPLQITPVRDGRDMDRPESERRIIGYSVGLEEGDTVYAARRGIVLSILSPADSPIKRPDVKTTAGTVRLDVEHADGSRGCYTCLEAEHLLVGVGDEVLPGTPLGLAGSYDGEHHFTVFMLTRRAFDPGDDPLQAQPRTRYVKGRFATAEGDLFIGEKRVCQGVMNDDLLLRELSKRELKRWHALHR